MKPTNVHRSVAGLGAVAAKDAVGGSMAAKDAAVMKNDIERQL